MAALPPGRQPAIVGLILLLATLAAFGSVGSLGFVYDDHHYVVRNPHVAGGFSAEGLRWAFVSAYAANWHPLTWISHMLDVSLFGPAPAGHHLTNLVFHLANTLLVFLLLRSLTGALWRPALAAALFALHPLRVESVAWVAERKDVLSAFFGLLALVAYTRQVRAPSPLRRARTAGLLALGLLAKPMLVTLPIVMLLLDLWPLGRFFPSGERPPGTGALARLRALVAEKTPLLLLAAAAAGTTLWAQGTAGAIASVGAVPLATRLFNAVTAYVRYLGLFLWPVDLALPYPLRVHIPAGEVVASCALLGAIAVLAFRERRRRPYLLVGYLWLLGMLVPVIGLVQVGNQALADRYTYLPLIGVGVAVAWGSADLVARFRVLRVALPVSCLASLVVLGALARSQVTHWRDEVALFGHAVQVTTDNAQAHNNLGVALEERGRDEEAVREYRRAVEIDPAHPVAQLNLGRTLARRGDPREAERHLLDALALEPDSAAAHEALGKLLIARGGAGEGVGHLRAALRLEPDSIGARRRVAEALTGAGLIAEAAAVYGELVRLDPGNAGARVNLGVALSALGRSAEAEREIRESLRLAPGVGLAHRNLAVLLDGLGRLPEAIEHYREAVRLDPEDILSRSRLTELLAGAAVAAPSPGVGQGR